MNYIGELALLALKTLATFNMKGLVLLPFVRNVISEYLKNPNVKIRRNPFHRKKKILTFENAFVHFPRPPITNKIQQCIYLYGDIYSDIKILY